LPIRAAGSAYGKVPLSFELNAGQVDSEAKFLSRGRDYDLFLTPSEAVLALPRILGRGLEPPVIRLSLDGASPKVEVTGVDPLPARSNYLLGSDPSRWRTGIPHFKRVRLSQVYPGVDLYYHGSEGFLEFDFVVAPGVDPSLVKMRIAGVDSVAVGPEGDLVMVVGGGSVRLHKPVLYQETPQGRVPVDGGYQLRDGAVAFRVGSFDRSRPLVIDPTLGYSTYLGGHGDDLGRGIAVDSLGSAYVVGTTTSSDFPKRNPLLIPFAGGRDGFVTKFNPAGDGIVYSTYIGGNGEDDALAIALNVYGEAFVAGSTRSTNFPAVSPYQATHAPGVNNDAFVAKLNANGNSLVYSTYLGGGGEDAANGIALDWEDYAYIVGVTTSTDLPVVDPLQSTCGSSTNCFDAFVAKLSPTGNHARFCTYLGGAGDDTGTGIAVDSFKDAYVTGYTKSSNFPMESYPLQFAGGGDDAFVAKIQSNGAGLIYSTFLGGSSYDYANAIAVDRFGNAFITGTTGSTNFPVTSGAFQTGRAGLDDAFVTKLNDKGSGILYSTFLGGEADDAGTGIAVDRAGNAFVAGWTSSYGFPVENAIQADKAAFKDVFVLGLNHLGKSLLYSTFLGGSGDDMSGEIALGPDDSSFVTGTTQSSDYPVTVTAYQGAKKLGNDAIVSKVGCTVTCSTNVPATGVMGKELAFEAFSAVSDCTGSIGYEWDFGDGTAHSFEQKPKHTYDTLGTFTWTMKASLGGGCSKTGTIIILHPCALTCVISAPTFGWKDNPAYFFATVTIPPNDCTEPPNYYWLFGDGTSSTEQNPTHTYTAEGSFNWSFTATANGQSCSQTGTITTTAPSCPTITLSQVDVSTCPAISVVVNVTDSSGNPIGGLSAASFGLKEDNVSQNITVAQASSGNSKLYVGLSIDNSGSLGDQAYADEITASRTFVSLMVPNDYLAIYSFTSVVTLVQDFTSDKALLDSTLAALPYDGGATAVFDSIYMSLQNLANQTGRRAAIVMTDGEDNSSTHSQQDVITYAKSLGIPVYTIGFGGANAQVLGDIANQTGGKFYASATSADLQRILTEIKNFINNQYIISYTTLKLDSNSHDLEVSVINSVCLPGQAKITTTYTCPAVVCPTLSVSQIDTSACPYIRVIASLTDATGTPVGGQDVSKFCLKDNGVLQSITVTPVGSTPVDRYVAINIDNSGSLGFASFNDEKSATRTFISLMDQYDNLALYSFDEEVSLVHDFSDDKVVLGTALENLPYLGGATAVYDALWVSLTNTASKLGPAAVIIMTDGEDNSSTHTQDEVITYAKFLGLPIYTIGFGGADPVVLAEIANQTGGKYYPSATSANLQQIMEEIKSYINSQFLISYTSALTGSVPHYIDVCYNDGLCQLSIPASFTCTAPACVAVRTTPQTYFPGLPSQISIKVTPTPLLQTYALEETPPIEKDGIPWAVSDITNGGRLDPGGKVIRWGPFFDTQMRTFSYTATPPENITGTRTFSGQLSVDGVSRSICGSSSMGLGTIHPADLSDDFKITADETTAYGSAWKRGIDWVRPPNPIPVDYVTNAGLIWFMGEDYHYDASRTPPWVPGVTFKAASVGIGSAVSTLAPDQYVPGTGVNVSITVTPDGSSSVYALEDAPPASWAIASISDGGNFDATTGKVKWGPFFDHQVRVLTYVATPPPAENGWKSFTGLASYDGQSTFIAGERSIGRTVSVLPGDADGDGTVTVGELQQVINMFLKLQPVGNGADCNQDGNISIGELQKVVNAFLGTTSGC
jgi:VWFA-related protein